DLGISAFTAAAYGGDIDYNGYGEFILAAGSFPFVFESNGANSFYENFLVNPFPVRGRYFIPGNPLSSPAVRTLSIESIVVADTDNDTFNEIIIGGVNKTWWGQYNGFVAVLENQIGTYAYTWWAPSRLMEDNPVYDLTVDNQDYDIYQEIIVGTFKGVVIYENYAITKGNRDNCYIERSILTSFVNFPYMKLEQMFDVEAKVQLALRNTDLVELQYNYDAIYTKGLWIQVFKAGQNIYWATSSDYGVTWSQKGPITTPAITDGGNSCTGSEYEYHPSIHQTREGRIFLSFTGKLYFMNVMGGSYSKTGIWLYELTESSGNYFWYNPLNNVAINGATLPLFHILYNPAVWDYGVNTAQGVGISYMNSTNGGIYWQGDFTNPDADPKARIPNIGRDALANNATWGKPGYKALSHDAVRSFNGEVVIAFTGMKFEEAKIDYDIWISKSNTSTMWGLNSRYNRATIDGIDELHPSITQTVT
ncbi:MAG: hypothetical protein KAT16_10745, partial [Candidatus Heimdallarchaeota archaeon]|nr:hypothetical protein [Candidatus Heimdallarchaeota archaeon]